MTSPRAERPCRLPAPLETLSSLALHLDYPAETVVETRRLEDVGCGVYPCYYRQTSNGLRVATSVTALVLDSGALVLNERFTPREFAAPTPPPKERFRGLLLGVPKDARKIIRRYLPPAVSAALSKERAWYETWDTVDRRIRKLRPFETVTTSSREQTFAPDFTLRDKQEVVERSAAALTSFVHRIEEQYPDVEHVMMIGGKDSQLMALIPKRRPVRWHVFSAPPNAALVKAWLADNDIRSGRLFTLEDARAETPDETLRKLIAGDLYSDPRHLRWLPQLQAVAGELGGACFFWAGTMSGPAHVYHAGHRRFTGKNRAQFFVNHFTRTACWQGNYHQVVKNIVGRPLLSPYHSREIWDDVYRHLDPSILTPGTDMRPALGEKLLGRPVRWPAQNPGPPVCRPGGCPDSYRAYVECIRRRLGERNAAPPASDFS